MVGKLSDMIYIMCASIISLSCAKPPNIVLIVTDDQDFYFNHRMEPLTKTRTLIGDAGILFKNMFVTTPLCCPSRSSILTGMYVHNHRTVNNSVDGNCSSSEWQKGPEKQTVATFLASHGYITFFAGKYLNQYGYEAAGGTAHIPDGWSHWNGLVGNSVYYNYTLSVDGTAEHHADNYKEDYLTDVISRKASEFLLDNSKSKDNPFFMMLSTPACHAPFTPAPQFSTNFTGLKAPRTDNFNTHGSDKHWIVRAAKTPMGEASFKWVDDSFRNRWRTLLSVDDLVENVVKLLANTNQLDNTYIIFTSDNGFHLGQFSLPNDKRQMYEFDIRVPLMIRGPGVIPGRLTELPVLNIDLAPTILDLAGIMPPSSMDGKSFKGEMISSNGTGDISRDFLVEHMGEYDYTQPGCPLLDGYPLNNCYPDCVCEDSMNNTYVCLRRLSASQNFIYCRFADAEQFEEVYDLNNDPYQMENIQGFLAPEVRQKLAHSLTQLELCSGSGCHQN